MRTVTLDTYVVDVLLADLVGHDRSPSAYLVYLWLAARREQPVQASYQELADRTGLSRSAAQSAVALLKRRRLLNATRASPTATPVYEVLQPWRRGPR